MSIEAMKLALEAFETLTQYNMARANIFRQFHPTATGDYVDLQEFREKALPAMCALREALAVESSGTEQPAQQEYWEEQPDGSMIPVDPSEMQPAQQQEPVKPFAWANTDDLCADTAFRWCEIGDHKMPVYTTPPPRKPLTDEMKKQMKDRCDSMEMRGAFVDGWLSAEAAHGVKGEA